MREEDTFLSFSPSVIRPSLPAFAPSPFMHAPYISTCLIPPLLPFVLTSFHPSPSPLCLYTPLPPSSPPPPVSPVYEGKFIGLPGAVSWRWPPPLKPQQGFVLHMEQKRHSGHTGLFPSARITHDGTLTPPIIY